MRPSTHERDEEARTFSTLLRRLDEETFAKLVTDLWVARGRTATRDGTTISVEAGATTRTFTVEHRSQSGDADTEQTVLTPRVSDESNTVDAAELLFVVRYAIERDRAAAILERYLGDEAVKFCSPGRVAAERAHTRKRRRELARRIVVATITVLLVTSLGIAVSRYDGGPVLSSSQPEASGQSELQTEQAAVTTQTETVVTVSVSSEYAALGCPAPPTDGHPALLRPDVVPGASASGLDGWRIVGASNDSTFSEGDRVVESYTPVVRHTATYVPPSGVTLTLVIDRWQSNRVATSVESAVASENETVVRWGQYTVVVRAVTADGESLSRSQTVEWARPLLSEVRRPSGSRLGFRCAESLLDRSTVTTTDKRNQVRMTPVKGL